MSSLRYEHIVASGINLKIVTTPWGIADYVTLLDNGIMLVATPSHGGFFVPDELVETMPAHLRSDGNWFEEDCEFLKVVMFFPHLFTDEYVEKCRASYTKQFIKAHAKILKDIEID